MQGTQPSVIEIASRAGDAPVNVVSDLQALGEMLSIAEAAPTGASGPKG